MSVKVAFNKKVILVLGIILGTLFFIVLFQLRVKKDSTQSQSALNEGEIISLVKSVGKLMELPKDENPTLATVSDKAKLQDQSFFKNAENGDKVLLYEKNRKAILFRPSTGKIIEISTIATSVQTTPSVSPTVSTKLSPTSQPKIKLAIFNGTKVSGLASATEKKLSSSYPEIEVTQTGNANESYTKTLIVDVTGKHDDLINRLSSSLSATKSTMPQSESKPIADIAIFLGQ